MGILDFLTGPLERLLGTAKDVVDEFHLSGEERLKYEQALMDAQNEFNLKLIEAEQKLAAERADVIKTEMTSDSWLSRNWRPILMLVFTYIVAHNYVLAPVLGIEVAEMPAGMWTLLNIGVGGYIGARTVEKIKTR